MKNGIILTAASLFFLLATAAFIRQAPPPEVLEEVAVQQREYIGATRCRMCHRTEEQGKQYDLWLESPHAKAYATLASAESKKIAAEKGIADPQKSGECLSCHVTAYGVDAQYLGSKYSVEEGVSCESCHGAGGDYQKKSTMEAISAGTLDGKTVGLVHPTEALCKTCHNEKSPTFKAFNFATASKQIAHPTPKK